MAKSKEKNKALELRRRGESIIVIAKKIRVAKSTVSLWCRDIELTTEQIERLRQNRIKGGYAGRIKGARMQYQRRLEKIKKYNKEGAKEIGKLSDRDLLMIGVSFYWGEGSKKRRSLTFSNSDPEAIKIMLKFLKKIFKVKNNEISPYVGINKIHKNRVEEVEDYWSKVAKIPRRQFTKISLKDSKNKKNYANFSVHYGTLTVRVKKSADLYYRMMGLIDALN